MNNGNVKQKNLSRVWSRRPFFIIQKNYRVVFVPTFHVIADELDVSDSLLQFERIALLASEMAHVTQVGRNGWRRRWRWWWRRRWRQIIEIDDLTEEL